MSNPKIEENGILFDWRQFCAGLNKDSWEW